LGWKGSRLPLAWSQFRRSLTSWNGAPKWGRILTSAGLREDIWLVSRGSEVMAIRKATAATACQGVLRLGELRGGELKMGEPLGGGLV